MVPVMVLVDGLVNDGDVGALVQVEGRCITNKEVEDGGKDEVDSPLFEHAEV